MNLNPFKTAKDVGELEEKGEKKQKKTPTSFQNLWMRIGVLAAIAIVGFVIVSSRYNTQTAEPNDILGAEEQTVNGPSAEDIVHEVAQEAQKQSVQVGGDILGVANEMVDETKEQVSDTMTKTIVDATVNNLISQIEKLPGVQKDEVRKYVCE